MVGWIGALSLGWTVGGSYGALNWHAHEMLFGYTSAALAGFMLTAIPNWTGRLPVSGKPLLALACLWTAGRLAMLVPDVAGIVPSIVIDNAFLPVMAIVAGREIISGRNWKNLKILFGLTGLSLANAAFHYSVLSSGQAIEAARGAIGVYLTLIAVVGGRIVPSFTRNWLVKRGVRAHPAPHDKLDLIATAVLGLACAAWAFCGETVFAASAAFAASLLQAIRLGRWRGGKTVDEPLLLVLHVGYGFVPIGMLCVGLSELGVLSQASALHVLTVGAIGVMTFAIMTRASLGHTGRALRASASISLAYLALILAAITRPFAELVPEHYHLLLELAGSAWMMAFGLFLIEYGPILVGPGRK